jgi:hypothetical protein
MENKTVDECLLTINHELGSLHADFNMLKWIVGFNLTLNASLIFLLVSKLVIK